MKILYLFAGSLCFFAALNGSGYPMLDAANAGLALINFGLLLDIHFEEK